MLLLASLPAGAASVSGNSPIRPADGRLREHDFAAQVTQLAWPDQAAVNGRNVQATIGHRFVVFTLQLAENTDAVSPRGSNPPVMASLHDGQVVQACRSRRSTTAWASRSTDRAGRTAQQITVSVSSNSHAVALVLSQGSFFQTFNL